MWLAFVGRNHAWIIGRMVLCWGLMLGLLFAGGELPTKGEAVSAEEQPRVWNQWRGPTRDGQIAGPAWPDSLSETVLQERWRIPRGLSYSGPIVSEQAVFTTATLNRRTELVTAHDRKTGEELWSAEWEGAITVPFFAAANGSWIRATPALDEQTLYVAGIRDVLVALDVESGSERWRVDFVDKLRTPVPTFGFVSSPLVVGNAVYVQAGSGFVKLDKRSGEVLWRTLEDEGGMMGSAFSSPMLTILGGVPQILVQTRVKLAGVDPDSGKVLWEQPVPNFRGMNILTPVVFNEGIFTSSYQQQSWRFDLTRADSDWQIREAWSNNARGYMNSPVVIDGHAYLHLQNQRFACLDLETGERKWTSEPFGKYSSLVANGKRILALDQRGELLLIQANPKEFQLLDRRQISEQETWAHLAVVGQELYIRELGGLMRLDWQNSTQKP